jgi:putative transposase
LDLPGLLSDDKPLPRVLVETVEDNFAKGMRQLNGVYTQHVNRSKGRVGHVFQGRYKAILVQKEAYRLELARYDVLNPVRAAMVARAQDWPWSSSGAMIGEVAAPAWLAVDAMLRAFGPTRPEARRRYVDFVRAGVALPSLWTTSRGRSTWAGRPLSRAWQPSPQGNPRRWRCPADSVAAKRDRLRTM